MNAAAVAVLVAVVAQQCIAFFMQLGLDGQAFLGKALDDCDFVGAFNISCAYRAIWVGFDVQFTEFGAELEVCASVTSECNRAIWHKLTMGMFVQEI